MVRENLMRLEKILTERANRRLSKDIADILKPVIDKFPHVQATTILTEFQTYIERTYFDTYFKEECNKLGENNGT